MRGRRRSGAKVTSMSSRSTTAWQARRWGAPQEALRLGACAQSASLPPVTSTTHSWQRPLRMARSRHLDGELVGAVEERHADGERLNLAVVGDGAGPDRATLRAFAARRGALLDPDRGFLRARSSGGGVGPPTRGCSRRCRHGRRSRARPSPRRPVSGCRRRRRPCSGRAHRGRGSAASPARRRG